MRVARLVVLFIAGLALIASARGQEWSGETSYSWVKNFSRTSYAPDRENAGVIDGALDGVWHQQLARDWAGSFQVDGGLEQVPDFPGADTLHAGAQFDVHRKFGLGPYATVAGATLGAHRYEWHEHTRNNWRAEASIYVRQRLTDSWHLAATGAWEEDYARHKTYDLRHRRVSIETTWDFAPRFQFNAGVTRLWGFLTANANQDIYAQALAGGFGPAVKDYYNRVPYEKSWIFGDDWVAYRVWCRANLVWAGISFAFDDNTSIPLRFDSVDVLNRAGVHYRTEIWSLSLAHRF